MHTVTGNRGEFLFLFALIISVPLVVAGRKKGEDGLRS